MLLFQAYKTLLKSIRENLNDLLAKAKERKVTANKLNPLSRKGIAIDLVSAFRGNSMVSANVLGDLMQVQATMYIKGSEITRRELVIYGVAVSNVSRRVMRQCVSLAILADWVQERLHLLQSPVSFNAAATNDLILSSEATSEVTKDTAFAAA